MDHEKDTQEPDFVNVNYEAIYDQGGVDKYIQKILEVKRTGGQMLHEYAFYLNSSDSLEALLKHSCKNKNVMTVAGSGEFSHAFINGGAKEVTMFDISPAAAFFGELRHRALCNLDRESYIKLFQDFTVERDRSADIASIINFDIYKKIRTDLSKEVREYFDTIEKVPALSAVERFDWNGHARMRTNRKYRFNRLVGEIITTDSEYLALQSKARKTKINMSLIDVNHLNFLVTKHKPDILYISNIAYYPQKTLAIAKKYIDLGVGEIMCTVVTNSDEFTGDYDNNLRRRVYEYNGTALEVGTNFKYRLYADSALVSVEVVGLDTNADYGITLKVTK